MKILFISQLFPLPQDSGGKIKSYQTIRSLASKHSVHLLTYIRNQQEKACLGQMENICESVRTVQLKRGKAKQILDIVSSFVSKASFIIHRDFRKSMQEAVNKAISDIKPDVIHIDHLQMAQFVNWNGPYNTVLDEHNVEWQIIERIAETSESVLMRYYAKIEYPKLKKYEISIFKKCDALLTVSSIDKETILNYEPDTKFAKVVPVGVDTDYFAQVKRDASSKNILSIATMHWPPNVDSILHFYKDIYPIIKQSIHDSTFTIGGQNPTPAIQNLGCDDSVHVTGYLDDIRQTAQDCGVFIVPLRSGSGVRIKILNALAMGLPVISTSLGVEGLDVINGEHLIIADTDKAFADAVIRLLNDSKLADELGENGRKLISEKYSLESTSKNILDIYDEVFSIYSPHSSVGGS